MGEEGNGSEAWTPARLIPTAGIKGAREQEERATSALLAVLPAVPEFGKELVAELGAPRGHIDTYIEVSLDDGSGGRVRPDGAILARRGKRRWSALVEVKTGKNTANPEQITRYLEAGAREGFDGVLIIDNQILGGADDVPVDVPKSKLKKVQLWQLSWWRIITEAILQHEHRGISDPDQAWILGELIAYLLHERSGAAELDDMGPSWVKVRDGARVDTLSAKQREVHDIARRWEQFVHYVALGLTQELGRDVVPRRLKKPLNERIAATCEELANRSRLSMSLKVPDAVGSLELTADLRARMTTTGVKIKAPEEGRPATQVRWVLRQLRNAPDDLRLETQFVQTSKTTTALLGDVRDEPRSMLLPDDPKREPRRFHLSLARPMGIKKGTGPGAFITDTRQQAIDFYRDLVQHLRDWQPKAPKLREERPKSRAPSPEEATQAAETDWQAPPEPGGGSAGSGAATGRGGEGAPS